MPSIPHSLRTTTVVIVLLSLALSACSQGTSTLADAATGSGPSIGSQSMETTSTTADGLDLPTTTVVELATPTTIPSALDLPGFDATIDLSTCELDVSISNDAIGFGYDSADIGAEGRRKLGLVADQLAGATNVVVVGHTSTEGSAEYNQSLSQRRAQAVADILAAMVVGARFDVRGAGETQPLVHDDRTEPERARNRRVAIHARIEAEVCD